MREAADEIRRVANLSFWQVRRLYCVMNNGVSLLSTTSTSPTQFLRTKSILVEWPEKDRFTSIVQSTLKDLDQGTFRLLTKDHSLRLTTTESTVRDELFEKCARLVRDKGEGTPLYVAQGSYADLYTVDISPTNKKFALTQVAAKLEISTTQILCVGDMGDVGGNDFDLLQSSSGFSVHRFSQARDCCFPIAKQRDGSFHQVKGPEATAELLERLRIFPDLFVRPANKAEYLSQLRSFEKLAVARSRTETESTIQHLRLRLGHLIDGAHGHVRDRCLKY